MQTSKSIPEFSGFRIRRIMVRPSGFLPGDGQWWSTIDFVDQGWGGANQREQKFSTTEGSLCHSTNCVRGSDSGITALITIIIRHIYYVWSHLIIFFSFLTTWWRKYLQYHLPYLIESAPPSNKRRIWDKKVNKRCPRISAAPLMLSPLIFSLSLSWNSCVVSPLEFLS